MRVPREFSVECYIRPEKTTGKQALISKRPYYYLGLDGDKPVFEIGDGREGSSPPTYRVEGNAAVTKDKWHHLAATVGTTDWNYTTAAIFLDGKPVGNINLIRKGFGKSWPYHKVAYYVDARPESGPAFRQYGRFKGYHAASDCHLHLGVDNVTGKSHYAGLLDEVSLYGFCFQPEEIEALGQRGYSTDKPGVIISEPNELEGAGWGQFQAEVDTPPATAITFDVLDGSGDKVLKQNVKSGDSIADIKDKVIRFRATLKTQNPVATPILRDWRTMGMLDD
jgi:hypothetical protein